MYIIKILSNQQKHYPKLYIISTDINLWNRVQMTAEVSMYEKNRKFEIL